MSVAELSNEILYPDDPAMLPDGSHVDGRAVRHPIDEVADFVVVGSGAAGAASAVVLAEAGYSVAIVEEGEWVRTREFGPQLKPVMKRIFRGRGTASAMGRSIIGLIQGSCVGGSTTINSAIAWRAPDAVIDHWSRERGLGDEITVAALAEQYDVLERDLSVRAVSDEALGLNNGLFGEAATKLGFESHRIRRYDAGCRGSAGCLTGCRTAKKLGMNVSYVPRALHAGARIYSSTHVDRIESIGGRASGVVGRCAGANGSVPFRLRARRGVFVGASAIQTPNLLRHSGIRSRDLGLHFQCHPGVSMMGAFDHPVQMDYGAAQGYNSLAFLESDRIKLESLTLPPELAVSRLPGFGTELMKLLARYPSFATWAVVIRSEAEGTIRQGFGGGDAVSFTPTRRDMERARKGLKILAEMMFAVGAREVYPGVHGMPSVIRDASELDHWDSASTDPRAYNMISSHLFGAARMSPDPRAGVVGTDFQCHELRGLYVVDSSVFPTNLGVNPQHTIMAMARLAARRAAERPLAVV